MNTYPFALYDAFSDIPFGGSQAAVIFDAAAIDADVRLQIAKEFALPATCFVSAYSENSVSARFQSTKREYPMCGHGTICLMTHMLEAGIFDWKGSDCINVSLDLPTTKTSVEIYRRRDGRPVVMLDISVPEFRQDRFDKNKLADLLGLSEESFDNNLPVETARGDFVHLIVAVKNLSAMRSIVPDFPGIKEFCENNGFETIACFCLGAELSDHHIHVRDFCPAVGVPESAAAGTTNAALTSYLIRHGLVKDNGLEKINIKAEQGLEIKRPSSILSVVVMKGGEISRLQIGGVATKIVDGNLVLPA